MTDAKSDDTRIREVLKGRRAVAAVPVPGMWSDPSAMVGVRVLSGEEVDECKLDGNQYVMAKAKARGIDPVLLMQLDSELLDEEQRRAITFRAFVRVTEISGKWEPTRDDKGELVPFFGSPQAVRQLDTVLLSTLFQIYLEHQQTVNPLRSMGADSDELRELADALKKEQGTADHTLGSRILSQLDAPTLRVLALTMGAQRAS